MGKIGQYGKILKIKEVHGEQVALQIKSSSDKDLIEFLNEILPDFDRSRVYVSDIKKVITWYNLLAKYVPELFVAGESTDKKEVEEAAVEAVETPKTEI